MAAMKIIYDDVQSIRIEYNGETQMEFAEITVGGLALIRQNQAAFANASLMRLN